jgi:hypothetical protein
VRSGSRKDSKVSLPEDISLDTRLWQTLKERLSGGVPA